MRTETINVYKFDELTTDARHYAWEHGFDYGNDHDDEYRATLEAFEKIFDICVFRYRVGDSIYAPSFSYIKAGAADDAPEGDALRLARYVWNNYAEYIQKGRYYSRGRWIDGKYTYKCRYSKIRHEMDNCPLTGVCYDCDILGPVIDCLHYKRFFNSYDELIHTCLSGFFAAWDAEKEYLRSEEYFAEMAEINEYEFLETGERYA